MNNKKQMVDVLFCGLLRKPEMFRKSILDLVNLRKLGLVNQIIFSTWIGEMEKNLEMLKFLKKNNVRIIESEEPKVQGSGHIWCQMKALDIGLQRVGEDRFVLKSRTDVYINPLFLKKLFSEKETLLKIKKDLPKGNVFNYKIWIHYYEMRTPFHMGEECFFAHNHDAKLLVNYNTFYDEQHVGHAISHIRRFANPFLEDYSCIKDYLKGHAKNSLLKDLAIRFSKKFFEIRDFKISRKISEKNKFKNIKNSLEKDIFVNCLAAYYSILYSHFYIDNRSFKDQVIFREASESKVRFYPTSIEKNLIKEKANLKYSGQIYIYDEELLKNIINKNLEDTSFSRKLIKAINKFNEGLGSFS